MFVLSILVVLLLFDVLVLALSAEHESWFFTAVGGAAFVALVGGLAYMAGVPVWPVGPFLKANWYIILGGFAAYAVLGVPWTFVKWWRFARKVRADLTERLERYPFNPASVSGKWDRNADRMIPPTPHEIERARILHYESASPHAVYEDGKYNLPVANHKGRITLWLALWPFSMIGTAFDDLFIRLWENLYQIFRGVYQRISDAVFAEVRVPAP